VVACLHEETGMTNLVRNLRFGFRLLVKNLGFTSVALLALTLGIGANTAIFSVIYAALLSPLPYPNPDQLVMVWSKGTPTGFPLAIIWIGNARTLPSRISSPGVKAPSVCPYLATLRRCKLG
jgi:hypothetical protein